MKNLVEGIQEEMNRCRRVLRFYEEIPTGVFGAMSIKYALSNAEKTISNGDVIEMLKCYEVLKMCE